MDYLPDSRCSTYDTMLRKGLSQDIFEMYVASWLVKSGLFYVILVLGILSNHDNWT